MATITSKVCDISAEHGEAESVVYGVDGEFFTADLCQADHDKLTKALDPFAKIGTPVSLRELLRNGGGSDFDPAVVRAWAQRNGKNLGDRGRIPADVVADWKAAGSPRG